MRIKFCAELESGVTWFNSKEAVDDLLSLLKGQGLRGIRFDVLARLAIHSLGQELCRRHCRTHICRVCLAVHAGDVGYLLGDANRPLRRKDVCNRHIEHDMTLPCGFRRQVGNRALQLLAPELTCRLGLGFRNGLMGGADGQHFVYSAAIRLYFLSSGRASAKIAFSSVISWSVLRPHE